MRQSLQVARNKLSVQTTSNSNSNSNRRRRLKTQSLILLLLTLVSTLLFEHSQVDLAISQLFYSHVANNASGHWLLQKGAQPLAFLFYNGPKALLMVLGLILITRLIYLYRVAYRVKHKHSDGNSDIDSNRKSNSHRDNGHQNPMATKAQTKFTRLKTFKPMSTLMSLSKRELSYLLLTLIIVPTVAATLKSVTHVSCPNHLALFNGDLPYLNIWQSIVAQTPAKCFPAAHASSGFALYAFAYLPRCRRHRYQIIAGVSFIGWAMGLYKMMIGDHFFSHTLVAMLLAATLASGLAAMLLQADKQL